MTPTTTASEIKSVEVVYTVADRRGDVAVSVSAKGSYTCKCDAFALYGGCKHTETVKVHRHQQGRKF